MKRKFKNVVNEKVEEAKNWFEDHKGAIIGGLCCTVGGAILGVLEAKRIGPNMKDLHKLTILRDGDSAYKPEDGDEATIVFRNQSKLIPLKFSETYIFDEDGGEKEEDEEV